jgi:ATP-dependent protease HslVU (ClpYQ) peptidase subunit
MSCLIAYKSGNKIYLGSDGAATEEDGDIRPIKTKKIFRVGDYLIGYAGSIRAGQIIRNIDPPETIEELIEVMRTKMEECGCLAITDASTSLSQSCFIVIHRDIIYEILSDFQLNEVSGNFTTIGCGGPYAFGAMHVIQEEDLSPSQKIVKALKVVSEYHAAVRPPYEVEKY